MIRIFGHDVALGQLVLRRLDQLPYIVVAILAFYLLLGHLKQGGWFDRRRIVVLGGMLLAVQTLGFVFLIAVSYGLIVPLAKPLSTDFVSFYAAGSLAAAGSPELAYDRAAHYDIEEEVTEYGITYKYFFYPPVFLLLCRALAGMPYLDAYFAFEAATLGLYLITILRGARFLRHRRGNEKDKPRRSGVYRNRAQTGTSSFPASAHESKAGQGRAEDREARGLGGVGDDDG
jgi:hypothetical protein